MPRPSLSLPMEDFHPFQQHVLDFIRSRKLVVPGEPIFAAVSGGPDSVALLHVLRCLSPVLGISRLTVLHFNHRLRGTASDEDEAFVRSLAQRSNLDFIRGESDVEACSKDHGLSLEMAARACRHRFFRQAAADAGGAKIAVGHTGDDQVEEILLRLMRGTGPSGLQGMRARTREGIIRPLLSTTRRDVLAYLQHHVLHFREDLSNQEPFCQRNILRLKVLPLLEKTFHAGIAHTLMRHARLVRDEESFWDEYIESLWPAVCREETPFRVVLRIGADPPHIALLRRLIRTAVERLNGNLSGIYAVHIESVVRLIESGRPGRSLHLPGKVEAAIEPEGLVFARRQPGSDREDSVPASFLTVEQPGLYPLLDGLLELTLRHMPEWNGEQFYRTGSPLEAHLDADNVRWPLTVRSWQSGDRFRPLGMGGSRKLQDYFTDARVPKNERRRVFLLCDKEKICWIIGHRLDDRVKIDRRTRNLLHVRLRKDSTGQ